MVWNRERKKIIDNKISAILEQSIRHTVYSHNTDVERHKHTQSNGGQGELSIAKEMLRLDARDYR